MKIFDSTRAQWRVAADNRAEKRSSARRMYTVTVVAPEQRVVTMADGRVFVLCGYSPLVATLRPGFGGTTKQYRRVHRWVIKEHDAFVAYVEAPRSVSTASILRVAGITKEA